MARSLLPVVLTMVVATPALAQRAPTRADSALVARILLAEDRRDSSSAALLEGTRNNDRQIQLIARRAIARIQDPQFASRTMFPTPVAPPAYPDPAWRLRYRALATNRSDCAALRGALADSVWHVRLRAADLAAAGCAAEPGVAQTLRDWVSMAPATSRRPLGGVSWHAAAHALVALARIAPATARAALPTAAGSPIPPLRAYAARAAAILGDTTTLRLLAADPDDNVKEAAIDGLAHVAGHSADDLYLAALSARGYQAIRAAARALRGSPRGGVGVAALTTLRHLLAERSQNSHDARDALMALDSVAASALTKDIVAPAITLPPDAVALAFGRDVRLRVVMADSSGGGAFVVRLRGDVAPIMAARVLALARSGWYNGTTWHRVEPDFVLQGGGPGANEYIGHPLYIRDELYTLGHQRGTVGMSTRGHDTGDAQWFVNLKDNPRLTRDYTIFAEVTNGIDVVDGVLEGDVIARVDVMSDH